MQTKEQILETANAWKRPAGLIVDGEVGEANGKAIAQAIDQICGGTWNHENLDAVVARLGDKLAYNVKIVEKVVEKRQTQEEVNEVFRLWREKHAPKTLVLTPGDHRTDGNVKAINAYVKTYHAGLYTVTSLSDAATHGEGLQHFSAKEIREAAEAKERDRYARDFREGLANANQKERDFAGEVEAEQKKEEAARQQEAAKVQINNRIAGYVANRMNGPGQDYALTKTRQEELRRIAASEKDQLKALAKVSAKIMSYPG